MKTHEEGRKEGNPNKLTQVRRETVLEGHRHTKNQHMKTITRTQKIIGNDDIESNSNHIQDENLRATTNKTAKVRDRKT